MTLRQRKRGGAHFALTCDGDRACPQEFRSDSRGVSSYTVRHEAAETGWTTDAMPWTHATRDYCPEHSA